MEPRFFAGSEAGDWTSLGIAPISNFDSNTTLRANLMASELEPKAFDCDHADVDIFRWAEAFGPQQQVVDSDEAAIANNTEAGQNLHQNSSLPEQSL